MKIIIQKREKPLDDVDEYFYKYEEIEIEDFRWLENHQLEYVRKNSCRWSKLEKDEELVGMNL